MGKIFNQKIQTEKRNMLRKDLPKAEVHLWIHLKGKQILGQKFRRQVSIGSYVVDFYCPQLNLAIEVDGATHITEEEIKYDNLRQDKIELLNISFLRFTNEEIYGDIENVINKITQKVTELMKNPPPVVK